MGIASGGAGRCGLFDVVDDLTFKVDRLVEAGATRLESTEDGAVELADPDGNEFRTIYRSSLSWLV